jgi:hypothetical protein
MFAQFYSYNGNVLLVRFGTAIRVYEVRDSGEVRAVRVKIPNGLAVKGFIPSERNWLIDVGETLNMADETDTIYEVSPENGEALRQYRMEIKNQLEQAVSCQAQGSFRGIGHQQGRLTMLQGIAEPATEKAGSVRP